MLSLFPAARADILILRQDIVTPSPDQPIEVTTFVTENRADRLDVIQRLERSLAEDRAVHPELSVQLELLEEDRVRKPSAVSPAEETLRKVGGEEKIIRRTLPRDVSNILRGRYPEWFLRNSNLVLSLVRGVVNGGVSIWNLSVTHHLPPSVAIPAGLVTGAISGGLQLANEPLQKYISSSSLKKFVKNKLASKVVKESEILLRWYAMEMGFVAAIQVTLAALGHPPAGTFATQFRENQVVALKDFAGQGFWDLGLARVTKRRIGAAKTLYAKKVIQFRSNLIAAGISALSVTTMVTLLAHIPLGDTLFVTMGATGVLYFGNAVYQDWKCRRLFRPKSVPNLTDPLTRPAGEPIEVDASATRFRLQRLRTA